MSGTDAQYGPTRAAEFELDIAKLRKFQKQKKVPAYADATRCPILLEHISLQCAMRGTATDHVCTCMPYAPCFRPRVCCVCALWL
eukprot:3936112-Rhodomonas_salina.7